MKVFTCNDHYGHWPVGTASVIIAESEEEARVMLSKELSVLGNEDGGGDFTLVEIDSQKKQVAVLQNGDY